MLTYYLVGGGKNARGYTALENPIWFKQGPPHYVADHSVLHFLGHKISHFLHDFHPKWFLSLGLPPSNGKHNQLTPFHVKKLLRRLQRSQDHRQDRPEINVYSRLEIGHKGYAGRQYVYCKPFKKFHSDLRMDKVLFIPPPPFYTGKRRDFEADLHSCWYGTVVLLFRMKVKSDSGEVWECDCAMIDVLYDLQTPRCTCRVISLVALQCISGHLIQVCPGPGVH
jgi:hypothetical protein